MQFNAIQIQFKSSPNAAIQFRNPNAIKMVQVFFVAFYKAKIVGQILQTNVIQIESKCNPNGAGEFFITKLVFGEPRENRVSRFAFFRER